MIIVQKAQEHMLLCALNFHLALFFEKITLKKITLKKMYCFDF